MWTVEHAKAALPPVRVRLLPGTRTVQGQVRHANALLYQGLDYAVVSWRTHGVIQDALFPWDAIMRALNAPEGTTTLEA